MRTKETRKTLLDASLLSLSKILDNSVLDENENVNIKDALRIVKALIERSATKEQARKFKKKEIKIQQEESLTGSLWQAYLDLYAVLDEIKAAENDYYYDKIKHAISLVEYVMDSVEDKKEV